MAALIFDSCVFTQVSGGPSDRVRWSQGISDTPGSVRIGDKSADNLADHALTARSPRIPMTGIAADALPVPAQCKELPWHP
jgi:hypothetical protein